MVSHSLSLLAQNILHATEDWNQENHKFPDYIWASDKINIQLFVSKLLSCDTKNYALAGDKSAVFQYSNKSNDCVVMEKGI